jgi:hypothetical protein
VFGRLNIGATLEEKYRGLDVMRETDSLSPTIQVINVINLLEIETAA